MEWDRGGLTKQKVFIKIHNNNNNNEKELANV